MLVDINPDEWRCRSCDNLMSEPCKDCKPVIEATDAIAPTEGAKPVAQVYSAIERGDEWDYKVQRIRILDGANLNDGDLLYADAPAQTADVAQGAKSHQSKINPRVWLDDGGQPDSISGYDIGLGRP